MIPRMFIWVMVCINGDCQCERIQFGKETVNELRIVTATIVYDLKFFDRIKDSEMVFMRSDTSYYTVKQNTENGVRVEIRHIIGGRKSITDLLVYQKPLRYNSHFKIQNELECFQKKNVRQSQLSKK
jgi:hypothetical protein